MDIGVNPPDPPTESFPTLPRPTVCSVGLVFCAMVCCVGEEPAPRVQTIAADQAKVALDGRGATWQLLVSGAEGKNKTRDVTSQAVYRSRDPHVAEVDAAGLVTAQGNGETVIEIAVGPNNEAKTEVAVVVTGTEHDRPLNFENDISPSWGNFRATHPAVMERRKGRTASSCRCLDLIRPPIIAP
jgi:hypothetical protein